MKPIHVDGNYRYNESNDDNKNFHRNKTAFENNRTYDDRNICVFCKQNHFSSRCNNITDINQRISIIKRENRCFVCV